MRRPEGHRPSYPAFTARFPDATDAIVFAQFAVRGPDQAAVTAAARELDALLTGENGPRHVDRVRTVHEDEQHTRMALVYWDSVDSHRAWWSSKEVTTWWEELPEDGPLAYWREVATIPVRRFETMHSGEWPDNGVSNFTPIEVTELHDYWGGMRDRIRDSRDSELDPQEPDFRPCADGGRGRRVRFSNPDNLAFIRTAQDWSHCGEVERATYTRDVAPTLRAGAQYIADHRESGCTTATYVQELDATWSTPQDRTCVLAWWVSLNHLEEWTVNHPTHQAIFGAFHGMLQRHDFRLDLRLWHEVCVLPAGAAEFEYVNCAPGTGLLAAARP
ncbi:phenylacetaldoxime dehydratase family protein [Streptomyces neyagawaensis]|uniref:phenylacetaldoxime dehydratase family protein n=1 Tax=Streptomyces neyagawaensis TaxID=42238 RepID=UPI0006E342AD|nr:phenylacetaldoxime dehydratase family protein [Streptomyces neyagawaensis]MCL6737475.1 phenylacetaldoxime dehydratase family protein [Streptomyces neyagawaensis]MDE1688240.1 phenylacetaldoxime dehydratase family protein [Streptomyces neyagawaensis]